MPRSGRLLAERRIPGRLFSVSAATTRAVPGLFTRNERMVARFDSDNGPFVVVMVAALLVAGIETVWGGRDQRRPGRQMETRETVPAKLERGAEMGRFHWGIDRDHSDPRRLPGLARVAGPRTTGSAGSGLDCRLH